MDSKIVITGHAYRRARERLGIGKKATERLAYRALKEGELLRQTTPNRMDTSMKRRLIGNAVVVWSATDTSVITIYRWEGI